MINVDEWAEVRRLYFAEGLGIKTIARQLGVARNTVRTAVRSTDPPRYERQRRPSLVDPFEPVIGGLLKDCPTMPATVIAERIDWPHGITILRDRVAELRPLFRPPDPAQRTTYRPGEVVQFDLWQPETPIPVGFDQEMKLWVVTAVSGFSRFMAAWMVPSRAGHDVLAGMLHCFDQLGAVPRTVVWDGEGCIGQWRTGRQVLTEEFQRFRGALGVGVRLCKPADPEAKGMNERANGYYETSFLPGRRFSDVDDFNDQLTTWLGRANRRVHAGIHAVPADLVYEDRGSMRALPPVLPDPALRLATRLPRDHYVRVESNDYSVNPRMVGRRVEVRMDLTWVVVTCGGVEVARHRRCLAKHRSLLDPAHAMTLRMMRAEAQVSPPAETDVEVRDLADYDRALGVA
ncbi:MAG TPA: IS21 family transposase [Acidimicrobiales bacterium]|jgi:transposase|nr:IS21 family transposase [Acidimicrobiales bacterium]